MSSPRKAPQPPSARSPYRPERLIVVGAADGMGRWLCEHLFNAAPWEEVTLIDLRPKVVEVSPKIVEVEGFFAGKVTSWLLNDDDQPARQLSGASLGAPSTAVCITVPQSEVALVAGWLLPSLAADSVVFEMSSSKVGPLSSKAQVRSDLPLFGVHPLFGTTTPSAAGQTFVFCPSTIYPTAHEWLTELIGAVGGLAIEMTAERHDLIMSYIQTATHQAILLFSDVIAMSGFDPEELWAFRTPIFEGVLSLTTRVIAPNQERTSVSIQLTTDGSRVTEEFADAVGRLRKALRSGEPAPLHDYFAAIRHPFSGTLFSHLQRTASNAIDAMQTTRTQLAELNRTQELAGLRLLDSNELQFCRIVGLTPTVLEVEDVMVGPAGRAGLLHTPAAVRNARKLGLNGNSRTVKLGLGRVRVLSDEELQRQLDLHLGTLHFQLRVVIPESVGGEAAAYVAGEERLVRHVELVRQEPRLGQREVILVLDVRADADLDVLAANIRSRIDTAFARPVGMILSVKGLVSDRRPLVGFLGPAGTFSDQAAARLTLLLSESNTQCDTVPQDSFAQLVEHLVEGELDFVVLPLINSASGLVDKAVRAMLDSSGRIQAAGIIDVPVRFDAFASGADQLLGPGITCVSHDQILKQCSHFIKVRELVADPAESSVTACELVRDRGGIALAGPGVGEKYGLVTVAADVGDLSGGFTRFVVVVPAGRLDGYRDTSPILRSLCIGDLRSVRELVARLVADRSYSELLAGSDDLGLMVSTSEMVGVGDGRRDGGLRFLGRIPWSPPTAVVRPGAG